MRFGILGTAGVGRAAVVPTIQESEHKVAVVGSRDLERVEAYAEDLNIPRAVGSYEAVLEADIDAVYIPLPNALHAEWCQRAADAGLDILCEKPIAVDADEAERLYEHCAGAGVALMEGFMYRHHPRTVRALEIAREELSTIRSVSTTFSVSMPTDPEDIRFSPELGGGSLLDIGCYAVHSTRGFLGDPERVHADVLDTRDCGVDTEVAALFEYEGTHAHVRFGYDTPMVQRYRVDAENGWLRAEEAFVCGPEQSVSIEYHVDGRESTETFEPADHFRLQLEAFAEAVAGGDTPVDAADSVGNMRTLDAIRESGVSGIPVELEQINSGLQP